jgi:hypothetical protein
MQGWGTPEIDHTWTIEKSAFLRFNMSDSIDTDRTMRIKAGAFCPHGVAHQRLQVYMIDKLLEELAINEYGEYLVNIPSDLLENCSRKIFKFDLPDAISPLDAGVSNDTRNLGIKVFEISIE